MAERSPAFQFYPKDFLVDERVASMPLQGIGAYILLLCHAWIERGIPKDTATLARLCRVSPAAFSRLWVSLEPLFQASIDHPDRLVNRRMEEERRKQAEWREKSSEGGKRSAIVRLQPNRKGGSGLVTECLQPNGNSPSPSPSPSSELPLQLQQQKHEILFDESPIQHPRKTSEKAGINQWFEEEFWPAWPLKKGKEAARKAALKHLSKPELREQAMIGLKAQVPGMVRRIQAGEPTKWAEGWITGRRWEDEVSAVIQTSPADSKHERTMEEFDKLIRRDYGELYPTGH